MSLGQSIRIRRQAKRMSQRELAEKLGITSLSVLRWENGKTSPKPAMLVKINEVLGPETTNKANENNKIDYRERAMLFIEKRKKMINDPSVIIETVKRKWDIYFQKLMDLFARFRRLARSVHLEVEESEYIPVGIIMNENINFPEEAKENQNYPVQKINDFSRSLILRPKSLVWLGLIGTIDIVVINPIKEFSYSLQLKRIDDEENEVITAFDLEIEDYCWFYKSKKESQIMKAKKLNDDFLWLLLELTFLET